jgi:hypothetical protein
MDDNDPNSTPPSKADNPTSTDGHPVRQESQHTLSVPTGPQSPSEAQSAHGSTVVEELAFNYDHVTLAEYPFANLLPALISDHLKAPSLDGIDPDLMTVAQARAGFGVLIPGSDYLRSGDKFNLLWGGTTYPTQIVNEFNARQPVMGTQWLFSSPTSHIRQGKVQVCYDVFRDGARIGTSAILHVKLQDFYSINDKQKSRKITFQRKNRPQKKDD